jgi:hypothetical protein
MKNQRHAMMRGEQVTIRLLSGTGELFDHAITINSASQNKFPHERLGSPLNFTTLVFAKSGCLMQYQYNGCAGIRTRRNSFLQSDNFSARADLDKIHHASSNFEHQSSFQLGASRSAATWFNPQASVDELKFRPAIMSEEKQNRHCSFIARQTVG